MPKLCCTVSVYIYCHLCGKQWCRTCWDKLFMEPNKNIWNESKCSYYPDYSHAGQLSQGNHFTMYPGDKEPSSKSLSEHDTDVKNNWDCYDNETD